MQALIPFTLPISGMGNGVHHFDFQVDASFFAAFEDSPVKRGQLAAQLEFDKQPAMYVMEFSFSGTVDVDCNRCLEPFSLPVADEQRLLVKFGEPNEENPDVIYIPYGTPQLNVAQYLYEFILLSIPLAPTHDDADEDCDPAMLAILDQAAAPDAPTAEDEQADQASPWSALKDFNAK